MSCEGTPGGKTTIPKHQSRITDKSKGHWIGIFYFPPCTLIEGSPDTYSCCLNASRVGDKATTHIAFIGGRVPLPAYKHNPKASTGAPCKLINYKKAFRVGDSYDCGDIQDEGCEKELVLDTCMGPC